MWGKPASALRAVWCGIALFGLLVGVGTGSAYEWHLETVDSVEGTSYTSLALGEFGHPHISYCAGEWFNRDLKCAYRDASGWHVETVDTVGDSWCTSLALDGEGHQHISYRGDGDLKYARKDGSGWHIQTVDWVGESTSLALDAGGYPHISYYDGTYDDLEYAFMDSSGWHLETVDSEYVVGSYSSLALDGGGHPHIGYYARNPNRDLRYVYRDGSGWHIETVDSVGIVGWFTSLALDGSGYPHISYLDATIEGRGELRYAHRDASGWHIETVDSYGDVGWYTSLALDAGGFPSISYSEVHASMMNIQSVELRYAHRDGSGWQIETVDNEGDVGDYTSLALNGEGLPHISYCDDWNSGLKYAHGVGDVATGGGPASVISGRPRLLCVSPNPAGTTATILCRLGDGGELGVGRGCLKIFDHLGRLVAMPSLPDRRAGTYSIRLDLMSLDGRPVAPGVYLLSLGVENTPSADVERLVIVR